MLSLELMEERMNRIRVSANRLEKMKRMSLEEFLAGQDNFAVAEYHLRRSIEALFDIGRHIVAKKGMGNPENYKQVIELLGQHGVISQTFARRIEGMAGYQNRLVHGYANVSPEEIYEIVTARLGDFALFCSYITQFIEKSKSKLQESKACAIITQR